MLCIANVVLLGTYVHHLSKQYAAPLNRAATANEAVADVAILAATCASPNANATAVIAIIAIKTMQIIPRPPKNMLLSVSILFPLIFG